MDEDSGSSTLSSTTLGNKYQYLIDKTKPHYLYRWIAFIVAFLVYFYRIFYLNGWFIVTYMLGIYMLNQLIAFLSPQFDPDEDDEVGDLPTTAQEGAADWRPFSRRLPEYEFWHSCTRAVLFSYFATFFEVFDVPVFWPILLMYFCILFFITMKKQILHMIKYKYIPVSLGKPTYSMPKKSGGDALEK